MLLKLKTDFRGKKAGDIVERDLDLARRMIDQGIAEHHTGKAMGGAPQNKMVESSPVNKQVGRQPKKSRSQRGRPKKQAG